MIRRLALIFLAVGSSVIVVCCCYSGIVADLSMVVFVMGFPTALIGLAVARNGRIGPLTVPLGVLALILEGCGIGIFLLRDQNSLELWFGGVPLAAALLVYGLWFGPLLLVGLAYGMTFDRWELRESDLRRFEERRCGSGKDAEK